jgi:hypothetical protein
LSCWSSLRSVIRSYSGTVLFSVPSKRCISPGRLSSYVSANELVWWPSFHLGSTFAVLKELILCRLSRIIGHGSQRAVKTDGWWV